MRNQPYNKQRDVIDGLLIFKAHGGDSVSADHDIIFASPKEPLTDDEVRQLLDAGWFIEVDYCSCGADVDPDETGVELKHERTCMGWATFV